MSFDVNRALEQTYNSALKTAMQNMQVFLQKYNAVMSGEKQPPKYYVDTGQVEYWKNGFVNSLVRQYKVIEKLTDLLAKTRGETSKPIAQHLMVQYGHGRLEEIQMIIEGCKAFGLTPSFSVMNERAVRDAVMDSCENAPMSQIKVIDQYVTGSDGQKQFLRQYINIRKDDKTRRRLQRELGASIANGESQAKLIKRIQQVFGVEASNAKRIAQTEGTRVRNQAAYEADLEAK